MGNISLNPCGSFVAKANTFMAKTEEHALQGVNPGGHYQAIWCRDASYILQDWSLSNNMAAALQQLHLIWSHQIQPGREKLVYGRGSPEMKFMSEEANEDKQREFAGALPTTIYQAGFSEIYGQNPDIDSTALMISTTAWILNKSLKSNSLSGGSSLVSTTASEHSADYVFGLLQKLGITDPIKATDLLVPTLLRAVDYLASRDIDNDGLLEQSHNEDWMDTVLRAGKIVYSQACWILALKNLSSLLVATGKQKDYDRIRRIAEKAIQAVEQILWSEEDGAYIDIQETHHIGGPYRTLTQDVSLYLVAISENSPRQNLTNNREQGLPREKTGDRNLYRANRTLDTLKNKVWKEKWPLVTEVELKSTGPWILKPYQYHNHTFWPWTTGIEMLARSRFDRVQECNLLLSTLTSESNLQMYTFYEWINPITDEGNGAFPFRTGISAVRISVVDILFSNNRRRRSAED
ncbi:MAG TPA: GH116 family glycosyl hydrolase [Nitrososphaeraceae archaeon]|nr:GH116 family glycosyl hydrolase [Nitrososphaeraceae archaeon]